MPNFISLYIQLFFEQQTRGISKTETIVSFIVEWYGAIKKTKVKTGKNIRKNTLLSAE